MLDLDHLSADHLNDFYGSMQGFFCGSKNPDVHGRGGNRDFPDQEGMPLDP